MEDQATPIAECSRDGEGGVTHPYTATAFQIYEDRSPVFAPVASCNSIQTPRPTVAGDVPQTGDCQRGNTKLTASVPQHPNVPSFLQDGNSFEEVTFPGADDVSEQVRKSSSNNWSGCTHGRDTGVLSPQSTAPAQFDHGTAVHGSLDKTATLKPMAVLKASNIDERSKRTKARNIYHAQQSRRRRMLKRAVLEQESAWLKRDIRRLEADIRAISKERGLYVDLLLNHLCTERGDTVQTHGQ